MPFHQTPINPTNFLLSELDLDPTLLNLNLLYTRSSALIIRNVLCPEGCATYLVIMQFGKAPRFLAPQFQAAMATLIEQAKPDRHRLKSRPSCE
jgi:hypothetical protein